MRLIVILSVILLASCSTKSALEKSSYQEGKVCSEMIGTWFTDVTVNNITDGRKRDITRLERKADGSAYLKGISVYYKTNEVVDWEFPSKWSCDGDWYVESNEWGSTFFKIVSLGETKNTLFDQKNNLNAPAPIEIIETKTIDMNDKLIRNPAVSKFLGL